MACNRNILDPPEDLQGAERRHWVRSFKWFATMFAGEAYWDDYFGRTRTADMQVKMENIDACNIKADARRRNRSLVGRQAFCSLCGDLSTIVADEGGGICRVCLEDSRNDEEEDFWASIGCPG